VRGRKGSKVRRGRRRSGGPSFRRRRSPTRARLVVALQVAVAAVALAALLVVALRAGDETATPIAATGAVAGDSAGGGPPPGDSSFEPSSPAPIELLGVDAFDVAWRKPPRAALVFDVANGDSLYRRRATAELPIASLTKIMTALAVTEATRPDEVVRIPKDLHYEGSAVGVLPLGRRVALEPLLAGLLIVSGNDAAIALADHVSGSERRFVALMNEQARLWNLDCTHFSTPHGLSDDDRSCAVDLAVMTRLALRKRRIVDLTRRAQAAYRFPIKGHKLFLSGHNPLIRAGYPGTIGLKTGYTDAAGRCFVGVARRHGRTFGVVLLDSPDPGKQAARLLDLAFEFG
jgi:serine-type D-Ala-D-Ala carboxypeptidase (penicillin-binding protein 5/6)